MGLGLELVVGLAAGKDEILEGPKVTSDQKMDKSVAVAATVVPLCRASGSSGGSGGGLGGLSLANLYSFSGLLCTAAWNDSRLHFVSVLVCSGQASRTWQSL